MKSDAENTLKAMALVRQRYIEKVPSILDELVAESKALTDCSPKNLKNIHEKLHKLSGSAGTFGLAKLSERARNLEYKIVAMLDNKILIQKNAKDIISQLLKFHDDADSLLLVNKPTTHNKVETSPLNQVHIGVIAKGSDELNVIKQEVKKLGYSYQYFKNLDQLIDDKSFKKNKFDAFLCDIDMILKSKQKKSFITDIEQLPVIYFSNNKSFSTRLEAVKAKGSAFLELPLNVPKLVNTLEIYFSTTNKTPFRVLIVDDEVDLVEHYRLVLTSIGMEVQTISEPEKLLDIVEAFCPELVLMDIYLGNYWGADLAAVIRQNEKWMGLPIVYLSAELDLQKQVDAMRRGADDFIIKPISDERLISSVKIRAQRSRQLACLIHLDGLTGILKHDRVKEQLYIALTRAQRNGQPLSVGMIDLDNFKLVNDTYGHPVGDRVIKQIASILKQNLRASDVIGRYGGEEFIMVMPDCNANQAKLRLEYILESFSKQVFQVKNNAFSATFSAGVAEFINTMPLIEADALIRQADTALYSAKSLGRNQVAISKAQT